MKRAYISHQFFLERASNATRAALSHITPRGFGPLFRFRPVLDRVRPVFVTSGLRKSEDNRGWITYYNGALEAALRFKASQMDLFFGPLWDCFVGYAKAPFPNLDLWFAHYFFDKDSPDRKDPMQIGSTVSIDDGHPKFDFGLNKLAMPDMTHVAHVFRHILELTDAGIPMEFRGDKVVLDTGDPRDRPVGRDKDDNYGAAYRLKPEKLASAREAMLYLMEQKGSKTDYLEMRFSARLGNEPSAEAACNELLRRLPDFAAYPCEASVSIWGRIATLEALPFLEVICGPEDQLLTQLEPVTLPGLKITSPLVASVIGGHHFVVTTPGPLDEAQHRTLEQHFGVPFYHEPPQIVKGNDLYCTGGKRVLPPDAALPATKKPAAKKQAPKKPATKKAAKKKAAKKKPGRKKSAKRREPKAGPRVAVARPGSSDDAPLTIPEVEAQVAEAVAALREHFQEELNFTPESLAFADFMISHSWPPPERPEPLEQIQMVYGGYLGEVIRRHCGGQWALDSEGRPVMMVEMGGEPLEVDPFGRARRRLLHEPGISLAGYADTILRAQTGGFTPESMEQARQLHQAQSADGVSSSTADPASTTDDEASKEAVEWAAGTAERAVEEFRELAGVELDYSPHSLEVLDETITRLWPEPPEEPDGLVTTLGAYTGEVIRRHLGGSWSVEASGCPFLCNIGHVARLSPLSKAWKRLTQGENDSLAWYFASIQRIMPGESGPEPASAP